jgi:hypothetical protein
MGQNSLWEVQYGGISLFSGEVAPQDGVFFICCNTNAVWGKKLCGLCSMGKFSFFLLKSLHRMGYFLFVAFFHYKYGVFFLTPMQYGAKHFVGCAVWGNLLFF